VGQKRAGFHLEEDRELVSVILWDGQARQGVTKRDWKHKVVGCNRNSYKFIQLKCMKGDK
jgi:hypothetical protein